MAGNGREREVIGAMLRKAGVPHQGVLMVHSAFRALARDGYDADSVLDALVGYMDGGTLLLPTMSWRYVNARSPVFDELLTPSNTGILTEKFRLRLAERRSLHPTHSVAGRGPLAGEILGFHHASETPCDPNSPFGRMLDHGAYVLMLAVGMDCCTLIHHVEERMAPDIYCRPPEETERYVCRGREGREVEVRLRRHRFLARDYWQFQDLLAQRRALTVFRCDSSVGILFRAEDMYETARRVLAARPDAVIAKPGQRYRLM